ncbi:MAG: dephospho-CoA kinase [Schleiferiaceae bacterium]|nr:dephospho-CoA kinase [Schleiferiaceae bacterium]
MIVGLTGGIGSGKSTVALIFRQLGIPVYVADQRAKWLQDSDPVVKGKLRELLGEQVVRAEGVNRTAMASLIFQDKNLLKKVNAIIHPAVKRDFTEWRRRQDAPYILREAAILFESGTHRDCDRIIAVKAPDELRILRAMRRTGDSRKAIQDRMNRQWPQQEVVKRAHFVVQNDHSQAVIPQILRIHEDLKRIANPRG